MQKAGFLMTKLIYNTLNLFQVHFCSIFSIFFFFFLHHSNMSLIMRKSASCTCKQHDIYCVDQPVYPTSVSTAWIIRIFHECEVLIEKSVPRITVWHQEALPRSVPHTHNRLFFLHTYGCRHMNKNQIYLEIFCIRVSHFDFYIIL